MSLGTGFYTPTSGSLGVGLDGTPLNQEPIRRTELIKEARVPGPGVIQDRPNYVMVNNSGSYGFLYHTTASKGATSAYIAAENALQEMWITGSHSAHVGGGYPYKLDINPVAWRQMDGTITGTTGDVTFVFNPKSVKSK